MEDQLRELLEHQAIRQCLSRLARGEDRRDAELIRSCWWPNANFDYGVYRGSFDEYLAWVVPGSDAISNTLHFLGQSHFQSDGERWRVETYALSYHRVAMGDGSGEDDERDTCIGGRYLDLFERRDGQWRIAERTMLYDWSQDWGKAADWSQGIMGYPFGDDRFPGRARGDWSVPFFKGFEA